MRYLVGIGFAQQKFSCPAELALLWVAVCLHIQAALTETPLGKLSWWPWHCTIIRKSSAYPQNDVFPSISSARIRRPHAMGADTACKCLQRAERGAASPEGARLCCFIATRPALARGQCGTRKQSFYQERDLLPRGTRSAVVDVAAEKDLWENLRRCLTRR